MVLDRQPLAAHQVTSLGVSGIWFDTVKFITPVANPGVGNAADLPQRWQSAGNGSTAAPEPFPQRIGTAYSLPLGGSVPTGTIGLVEPGVGTALPGDNQCRLPGGARCLSRDRRRADRCVGDRGGRRRPGICGARAGAIQCGRRALARHRDRVDGGAEQPGRSVCRLGQQPRRPAPPIHRLPIGDLGPDQQSACHKLVVQLPVGEHVAPGSPFYKAITGCASTWRCATSRCSSRMATVARATFGNGLTNGTTSRYLGYRVMVGGTSLSTVGGRRADATLADVTRRRGRAISRPSGSWRPAAWTTDAGRVPRTARRSSRRSGTTTISTAMRWRARQRLPADRT